MTNIETFQIPGMETAVVEEETTEWDQLQYEDMKGAEQYMSEARIARETSQEALDKIKSFDLIHKRKAGNRLLKVLSDLR